MANELAATYLTGATLKAQMAQGASVINADITMTEVGSSGYYTGTVPASSAGLYNVYITATGVPVGVGTLNWDGSAEIKLPTVPASSTNITAGVITTATNLTNLPAITANWLTAAGIAATALDGKGDWNVGKTGYALTQTFPANFADMTIAVTTGIVDANIQKINDVTITGDGQVGTEFGV